MATEWWPAPLSSWWTGPGIVLLLILVLIARLPRHGRRRRHARREPCIQELLRFATAEECREVIELAVREHGLHCCRGRLEAPQPSVCNIRVGSHLTLQRLANKLLRHVGMRGHLDDHYWRIMRYREGEGFAVHADAPITSSDLTVTALVYLNDTRGGWTSFPALGLHCRPQQGKCLLFTTHRSTFDASCHEALPIFPGSPDKWVMGVAVTGGPAAGPRTTCMARRIDDACPCMAWQQHC